MARHNRKSELNEQSLNSSDLQYQHAFHWLRDFAPEFKMSGDNIKVLFQPQEFYSTLTRQLSSATKRISIASLYIGDGHLEHQLVNTLRRVLESADKKMNVHILLDYTRGSRGLNNSRVMLLPLLNSASSTSVQHDVQIALYHTPNLRGLLKHCIPERWNEIIGLAHMKIYVVDDTVIMSGANLSNDYFTNRQDRYIVFEDKNLADFFDSLVQTVSTFSFQLQKNNTLQLNNAWNIHPYEGNYDAFVLEARKKILNMITAWRLKTQQPVINIPFETNGRFDVPMGSNKMDSVVYPLIQMAPFGITHDREATELAFRLIPPLSKICLATGYFNLTSQYMNLIIRSSQANYDILTASPKANGFLTAKGISGSIPKVYTYLARLFYGNVLQHKQNDRITLYEYEAPNWSFHAKGLWCFMPNSNLPTLSLIGSPNFGYRSVHRDLETQVAIVTDNMNLRQQLHLEQQRLFALSSQVSSTTFNHPERYVPLWVRLIARVFKNFF